jgi:hypothetical protein
MSETAEADNTLYGLIPDWPVFDTRFPDYEENKGVQGASAYDYTLGIAMTDPSLPYGILSKKHQPLLDVLDSPDKGKPGEAAFVDGWAGVGRKWRLPNHFHYAEIEQDLDYFSDPHADPASGATIAYQVFYEKAYPMVPFEGGPSWAYVWVQYEGKVDIDFERKTFTLEDVPITQFLVEDTGKYIPKVGAPPKLARIALVFTYSHVNWTMYADTYLQAGEQIEAGRKTAILTGDPKVIERPDMRYMQVTNINFPLTQYYAEKIPESDADIAKYKGMVYQEALPEPVHRTYSDFLCFAQIQTEDGPQSGVIRNVPLQAAHIGGGGTLTEPIILRDDSPKLWDSMKRYYYGQGRRPRVFTGVVPVASKGIRRGQLVMLKNIANFVSDMDLIDTVEHDFVSSRTTFVTSNQPGLAEVQTIAHRGLELKPGA